MDKIVNASECDDLPTLLLTLQYCNERVDDCNESIDG